LILFNLEGGVVHWVANLTNNWSVVSVTPNRYSRCCIFAGNVTLIA